VSTLYQRFRHLIHEFAKFGVVGAIGFLVTEGVFNLMIHKNQPSFTANAVATLVAAAVTFLGNRYWTFRHRERTGMGRETAVFVVLNLIGIFIQQACLEVGKLVSGRHDQLTLNVAFLVGVALATLFRFWSYRKWVWLAQAVDQAPLPLEAEAAAHAREPALVPVPSEPVPGAASGPGALAPGGPGEAGRARPDGARHSRSGR